MAKLLSEAKIASDGQHTVWTEYIYSNIHGHIDCQSSVFFCVLTGDTMSEQEIIIIRGGIAYTFC